MALLNKIVCQDCGWAGYTRKPQLLPTHKCPNCRGGNLGMPK